MSNTSFTKTDTRIAKGAAICLMLYHHLFAFDRLPETYVPLFPALLPVLSGFGSICVAVFMLLSGIGLYHISQIYNFKKWCTKHLFHFICHYWLVFLIFVPVGFFIFERQFIWSEFWKNFFFLSYSYNGEWWYIRIYLEILILSVWFVKYILKKPAISGLVSLLLAFIGYLLHESASYSGFLIKEVSNLFLWQLLFCLGLLIANYRIFERTGQQLKQLSLNRWWFSLIILSLCMLLRQEPYLTDKLKDPLTAPIFLYFSVQLIKQLHLDRLFSLLGDHSLNIWLIHTFFCYYYLTNLVLLPRLSPLIFIWLLLLSLASSYLINRLANIILKGLRKWKKNISLPDATC